MLANVYAYDTDWKVEFLEDGKPLPVTRLTDEDPMSALFLEESDGKLNSKYKTHHLFQAVATTPDHPVTVRVSDSFGRVYSQTLQRPRPYAIDADYTRYVNPFIGNAATGHTFPGATVPFGLVQATPATGVVGWQYCSNYVYGDKRIWGFVQTALNGTGCVDLGNILEKTVSARPHRQDYHSDFDNATEQAAPGYYSVYLKETGVKAEMTATPHVAYHRYTFDRADSAGLYVNLQHSPVWGEAQYHSHVRACEVKRVDDHTLTGYLRNAVWVDKEVFFVMTFNRPMTGMTDLPLQEKERGNRMLFSFDLKPGQQLEVKVALSSATVEGAMRNMQAELPGWGFEQVRRRADNQWNNYLSRIQVEGTDEQKTNFYTSFYHALIQPNNIADVDGMYRNPKGELAKAEGGTYFSTFSTWDTYRAAHPFYTLMVPEMVSPFVRSMISHAEMAGYLPIWTLWGKENHCMIGNHSVPIIAEAYAKGFRGFDAERAWNAVKMTQTVPHQPKSNWDNYMKYGYFPTDLTATESVSTTLECGYDDYAASVMARLMGKKEDAAYFEKRAGFYKNLFDKETCFMRPRLSDGSWKTPFDPSSLGHAETGGGDYTEGNAWQYTWHVQHDVPGLINLFGGPKPFLAKLDSVFTVKLNSTLSDVTGLIGQYAHGNEPSHHVTYLYALAGRPERTQELIREIFDTQYLPKPDGLCGNDDCGQMSAWYMFSAMGFYPVNPVSGEYVFGAPQLPSITLQLPGGKTFTVRAEGLSKENLYVDKIYLNGKRYTKPFIRHEDIMKGGTLVFKMKK